MVESHRACRSLQFSTIPWARNPLASTSFPLTSLSDPHPLNTVVSYRYKNHSREGAALSPAAQSLRNVSSLDATLLSRLLCVANKGLAQSLSPLNATLTKNIGGGGCPHSCPHS